MKANINYDEFVKYLKSVLEESDKSSLNDLETLIEFLEDNPPLELEDANSDYAREEIERLAASDLKSLKTKLQETENTWLTIDNGKFILKPAPQIQSVLSNLRQNLSSEEGTLLDLHYDEFGYVERKAILSLYKHKIRKFGTFDEKYNALKAVYNSYEYTEEIDYNYTTLLQDISELSSQGEKKDTYKYYEDSAKHFRKKYEHEESAKQFKLAKDAAESFLIDTKNLDSTDIENLKVLLRLTRSMRIQFELAGDELCASQAFLDENKLGRRVLGKSERSWIHLISDNCQNPWKVAISSLILIFIATFIFSLSGITSLNMEQSLFLGEKEWYLVLWDSFYFSVVTFTTLGYGDFSPGDGFSRLVANIVSVLGLLFSSLFLVTLVRRYGR